MAILSRSGRIPAQLAISMLAACGFVLPAGAATVTIDATSPQAAAAPLPFAIGDKSPDGHVISANSQYLTLDGVPWYPSVGEFHYSRYPVAEWDREILKMKAGGIEIVSTYVFWIHHEETEGKFDWSGQRDLGRFVKACARHGLKVWIRIGPWAHGESRNGGFPDWLVKSGVPLRQNDPKYLAYVSRFFSEIEKQVHGQFWRDGGPIVGVQLENEYHPAHGGVEHMRELRKLALSIGMTPAFFSATGWDQATVPPTDFLPVFGGYTEQFWSGNLSPLPPNQNFFFTPIRAEDNVMGDLTPKIASYNSQYDGFPFLTAEMGGGMAISYHRRPIMHADDSTAAALIKVGSGANCLGYYMYHGGTNPDGLTPMQETQLGWNGYNDLEAKSYDFQAPLGEFGQVTETYRTLKTLGLFLNDFGTMLAPMTTRFPEEKPANRDDTTTPRVAARTLGNRGFIFVNNYERNYAMGDKRDFQVALRLPEKTVMVPHQPTTVPDGSYPIFPVNLDCGGVTLRYATAQLLCRLENPATLVFFAWPGLVPEFAFESGASVRIAAPRARISQEEGVTYLDHLIPGTSLAMTVSDGSSRPPTQIIVLTRDEALNFFKAKLAGRERLVLSAAGLAFDGDRVWASSRNPQELSFGIYPNVKTATAPFTSGQPDGVFQQFTATIAPTPVPNPTIDLAKPASEPPPVRLSAPPRAVAMEPTDQDFDRAAQWNVRIEPSTVTTGGAQTRDFLRINYAGDVARMYVGSRFDNDNFYKGTTWELGLWHYSPAELKQGLTLKILPLRREAPIFLERGKWPDFTGSSPMARLIDVQVVREYETSTVLKD